MTGKTSVFLESDIMIYRKKSILKY